MLHLHKYNVDYGVQTLLICKNKANDVRLLSACSAL